MRYVSALAGVLAVLAGCRAPLSNNLPPAAQLMHPGPGVGGPGPGVMMVGGGAPGMMAPPMAMAPTSQIHFVGPEGGQIAWDVSQPGMFDSEPLVFPARYDFPQGGIYRLKLTNVPGREGVELYPSLEVAPALPRTAAYIEHNPVPFQLTEEDFDQILSGTFVTKVIFLPDPEFQDLAVAGAQTLVSTKLDPTLDPIVEADRQGTILAIIRCGNKDLEVGGPGAAGIEGVGYDPSMMMGGYCGPMGPGPMPPPYVAGVTAPEYGMPMVGTPIGLPGPPHIPLGGPAGLQRHVMRNHTHMNIPDPTKKIRIDVAQFPGQSYPKPPSHAIITERSATPPVVFRPGHQSTHHVLGQGGTPGAACDENCPQ